MFTTSDPGIVARARADWRAADLATLEAECAVKVAHRRLKHATDHLAEVGGLTMGVPAAPVSEPTCGSCTAFLTDAESVAAGTCSGCRSPGPTQRVEVPPAPVIVPPPATIVSHPDADLSGFSPAPTPADEPAVFEVCAKPLPVAEPVPATDLTRLADIDGFPDAVLDKLAPAVTTLATLLEQLSLNRPWEAELPLRNRLALYLGDDFGIKLKHAEQAAEAVAARVSKDRLFFCDVPGFPAPAAAHLLREHKLRTLADVVEYIELAATRPDVDPVYEALRVLGLPVALLVPAGTALAAHFGDRFRPTGPVWQPSLPFEEPAATEPEPAAAEPHDKTAEWEALLGTPAVGGSGQDPKRMRAAIDEFREDQKAGNASPMWATWSEFDVTLGSGDVARVLSKPFWDRENGRHHIEFWSENLGPSGYWSVTIDRVSGKGGPLIQWAEAEAERRAAEYAAEVGAGKPAAAKSESRPAKITPAEKQLQDLGLLSPTDGPVIVAPTDPEPELPFSPPTDGDGKPWYGWGIEYRDSRGKTQHCHYVGTEKKARGKARLRTGFERLTACKGLTREQYDRTYGKGRM